MTFEITPRGLFLAGTCLLMAIGFASSHARGGLESARYFPNPQDAAFVDAVQLGNVRKVKAALAAGQSPNAEGLKGFRPIHFVFPSGKVDVARLLLEAGADVNAEIASGNRPLHYAVQQDNPDFTELFIQYHADVNAKGAQHQPVLFAALDSPVPELVIPMLARAGADINTPWGGYTPVQSAMVGLTWKAALALLQVGSDPAATNQRGETSATVFCSLLQRLKPTPTNHAKVYAVGHAIKDKMGVLGCEEKLETFR